MTAERAGGPTAVADALSEAFIASLPGAAAAVLETAPTDETVALLDALPAGHAAALLEELPDQLATDCLAGMSRAPFAEAVAALDHARAALLLGRMPEDRRRERMAALPEETARELEEFMSYPPDTAGTLMDTRVVTMRTDTTVERALARLRAVPTPAADLEEIVVTDAAGTLAGVVSAMDLLRANPGARLGGLLQGRAPRVLAVAPRNEVIQLMSELHLPALAVVDGRDRVLGIVRHEELVDAVREETSAELAALVGASKEERALSPALFAVRKRLPWLNINLLTAFLAASVVGVFESTIAQFTALAVLLPVVAGQSGNTGAQALAVVIRGLALREIRIAEWRQVVLKEAVAGLLNGIAIAVVTGLGVLVWSRSFGLTLVIFLAMIASMVIAGISGAAIPLVLSWLRQDPAQSGSIILTTVTDVLGFLSFLGLATLFSALL